MPNPCGGRVFIWSFLRCLLVLYDSVNVFCHNSFQTSSVSFRCSRCLYRFARSGFNSIVVLDACQIWPITYDTVIPRWVLLSIVNSLESRIHQGLITLAEAALRSDAGSCILLCTRSVHVHTWLTFPLSSHTPTFQKHIRIIINQPPDIISNKPPRLRQITPECNTLHRTLIYTPL